MPARDCSEYRLWGVIDVNWRRGLLRLWAALSLGWIIAVARACVVKSRVDCQSRPTVPMKAALVI
jgi:hypothetical protein